jgi:hypothetical protein
MTGDREAYVDSVDVRCPKCGHLQPLPDDDGVFHQGEEEVICNDCDRVYYVEVKVTISIISPEREP